MNQKEKNDKLWEAIVDDMKVHGGIGEYGFDAYISKLSLRCDTGTKLILEYPEDMVIEWVEVNYQLDIQAAVGRVMDGGRHIEFVSSRDRQDEQVEQAAPVAKGTPTTRKANRNAKPRASRKKLTTTGLNEDFRFDNFIAGPNSDFAYTAARSIVDSPCSLHNPLVISGASGMGKTHLMQAIGNALVEKDEDAQVIYLTSEDFTNDYLEALSHHGQGLNSFRRKYRKADVLLIDDVQFLAEKGKTQEEFFHTFNALLSSGKQIVLTTDCAPTLLTTLDSRLTSRFEQGLNVMLNPPGLETRIAILRAMSREWGGNLISAEVINFLAEHITCSVRRMKGALIRITSFATFAGRKPTVADARNQLKSFLVKEREEKSLSIESIQEAVAKEFDVRVIDLNGRRRTANIAHPRQLAMYLARQHTELSLKEIGEAFGGRDHGTVLHATKAVEERLENTPELKDVISRVLLSMD